MRRIIQDRERERLILFNKPFQVMCQFTSDAGKANLSDFIDLRGVYPAGRLDYDSEGLVVLTNAGWLQHRIAEPGYKLPKTYLAQVEKVPDAAALRRLSLGVELNDGMTRPAEVELVDTPDVWERNPPIRARKSVPTSWLRITITEGRNRQVRRMTAAVGHPTLRLIRKSVGAWELDDLQPGEWREAEPRINGK